VTVPAGPDEVSQPWWDATRKRRLVIQRCQDCGHWQHYPRALCTGCGGMALTFEPASGRGVVDTATTVMRTVHPELPAPYVVARVRLAEGPLLLTHLIDAGQDAAGLIGRRVAVDWAPLPDGRNLPVFRLWAS
jgi:uncharacterized OB-fold protein